jgi:hypothetical protein
MRTNTRSETDKLRDTISDIIQAGVGIKVDSYDMADEILLLFGMDPTKGSTIKTSRCVNCGQAIPHSGVSYCDRCDLL